MKLDSLSGSCGDGPHLEALEPRLLLSSLPLGAPADGEGPGPLAAAYAVADEPNTFGMVDLGTGAFTPVGTVQTADGLTVFDDVECLAIDPLTGVIYAVNGGSELITIDPGTGHATVIGDMGLNDVDALAFHPKTGELFAVDVTRATNPGVLYLIDKATAAATLHVALSYPDPNPLAGTVDPHLDGVGFSPTTGVLYGAFSPWAKPSYLVTVDLATGQLTVVGATGTDDVEDICFAADGTLFGAQGDEGAFGADSGGTYEGLVVLDPATGAATGVGLFGPPVGASVWDVEGLAVDAGRIQSMYPHEGFVRLLYQRVLRTDADPVGLATWVGQLDTGQLSPAQVAAAFVTGAEFQQLDGPISRLYTAWLGRVPDMQGLYDWIDAVRAGLSLEGLSGLFATCAEFVGYHGDVYNTLGDADWVDWIYAHVWGAAPDAATRQAWIDALGAGTSREQMVLDMAQDPQYVADTQNLIAAAMMYLALWDVTPDEPACVTLGAAVDAGTMTLPMLAAQFLYHENYATPYVGTLHQGVLLRAATPAEHQTWVAPLAATNVLATEAFEGFATSAEYEQYVAPIIRLYESILHRPPEPQGLNDWVNSFRGGMSLEAITREFLTCPELIGYFGDGYGTLTNAEFVPWVYQLVLRRAPSAAELAAGTAALDGGASREALTSGLVESPENHARAQNGVYVGLAYVTFLQREAEPGGFAD